MKKMCIKSSLRGEGSKKPYFKFPNLCIINIHTQRQPYYKKKMGRMGQLRLLFFGITGES